MTFVGVTVLTISILPNSFARTVFRTNIFPEASEGKMMSYHYPQREWKLGDRLALPGVSFDRANCAVRDNRRSSQIANTSSVTSLDRMPKSEGTERRDPMGEEPSERARNRQCFGRCRRGRSITDALMT